MQDVTPIRLQFAFTIKRGDGVDPKAHASVVLDKAIGHIGASPAEHYVYAFLYDDRPAMEDIIVRAIRWGLMDTIAQPKPSRVISTYTNTSVPALQAWHQVMLARDIRTPDKMDFGWSITLVKRSRGQA